MKKQILESFSLHQVHHPLSLAHILYFWWGKFSKKKSFLCKHTKNLSFNLNQSDDLWMSIAQPAFANIWEWFACREWKQNQMECLRKLNESQTIFMQMSIFFLECYVSGLVFRWSHKRVQNILVRLELIRDLLILSIYHPSNVDWWSLFTARTRRYLNVKCF